MPAAVLKPYLVVVACVRNEADIIEPFVRHHLAFAERMLILDHASVDGTREILRQLVLEGLPLEVITETRLGTFQSEWTTRLLRSAALDSPHAWIAPLDADEFLCVEGDFRLPPISETPEGLDLATRTYLVSSQDRAEIINPVERMTARLAREPAIKPKVIVPAAVTRDGWINSGNHRFMWRGEWLPTRPAEGLYLAHFPLRSAGQSAAKTATIYLQTTVHTSLAGHALDYYREPFLQLQKSVTEFRRRFPGSVPAYLKNVDSTTVDTPLDYRGGALRYSSPINDEDRLSTVLVGHAAALANAVATHAPREPVVEKPVLLQIAPSWRADSAIRASLLPLQSAIEKIWIRLPPGAEDSAALDLEVNGEGGALKVHSFTFLSPTEERLVWAGPMVERAVHNISGGFKWKTPGCLYLLKPVGKMRFRIALPLRNIFPAGAGAELAFSFERDLARLGARITASSANNVTTPPPAAKQPQSGAELEQLRSRLSETERNLAALRVAHDALQKTSDFFEAKARDAHARLLFLKWNPLNKLMLEGRRTWRKTWPPSNR